MLESLLQQEGGVEISGLMNKEPVNNKADKNLIRQAPVYAYDTSGSMENIMDRILSGEIKDKAKTLEYSIPPKEMFINAVKTLKLPKDYKFEDIDKIFGSTQLKDIQQPCSDVQQPIAMPTQQANEAKKNEITRFDEGVKAAIDQVELSWQYTLKSAEKMFTRDEKKREVLQKEIDEISKAYGEIPDMSGMAQVGSVGMNVIGVALPSLLVSSLLSPTAGGVVAGALTSLDMAKTASQANMEVDGYERSSGNKVSDADRAAYTTASVATDAIMNVLLGSSALKGASKMFGKSVSNEIKEAIMKNPVAQQEFNTMTRQVMKNEREAWKNVMTKEIGLNAIKSGVEGGVASGALEAEKSIYTHEAPELTNIVTSVLTGVATGMAQGAFDASLTPIRKHIERMEKDDVYYVSNMRNLPPNPMPISEVDIKNINKTGGVSYIKGEVSPSTGGAVVEDRYKADNVVVGSYRKAHKDGATQDRGDSWDFSKEQIEAYEEKWEDSKFVKNKDDYYNQRYEVVQDIASKMGVPIEVYKKFEDVPSVLQDNKTLKDSYAVTLNGDKIVVVLDALEKKTATDLLNTIRHEAVGHFGMPKVYKNDKEFNDDMKRYGRIFSGRDVDFEEPMSRLGEFRDIYQKQPNDPIRNEVYDILRRSESTLRNSTINELRHSDKIKYWDRVLNDGKPMPSLYEMEQRRRNQ